MLRFKLALALLAVVLAIALTAIAAAQTPPLRDGKECLPGTRPIAGAHRFYVPAVINSSPGVTPVCDVEIEFNDTHQAAQVVTGSCVTASTASSGDPDWYALGICSPVTLTVRTRGPLTSTLDIDLYLHGDPPGVPLAASEGPGVSEIVSAHLLTGTYYALVQPAAGAGPYELSFEVQR